MERLLLAAILVFGLGGCAAVVVGGAAVGAGVIMSPGEEVAVEGRDQDDNIPKETPVAVDTPDKVNGDTSPTLIDIQVR